MKFKKNGLTGTYESDCKQYGITKYQQNNKFIYIMHTLEDLVFMGIFKYLKDAEEFLTNYAINFDECAKYIWNRKV